MPSDYALPDADDEQDVKTIVAVVPALPRGTRTEAAYQYQGGRPKGKPVVIIDVTGSDDETMEQDEEEPQSRAQPRTSTAPRLFQERPDLLRELRERDALEAERARERERRMAEWRQSASGRLHHAETCSFCKRATLVEFVDGVSMCIVHYMWLLRHAAHHMANMSQEHALAEALAEVAVAGYRTLDAACHRVISEAGMGPPDMFSAFARYALPIDPEVDIHEEEARRGIRPFLPLVLRNELREDEREEEEERPPPSDWADVPCCLSDLAQDEPDEEDGRPDPLDRCPHHSIMRLGRDGRLTMCAYHFALFLMFEVETARRSLFIRLGTDETRLYLKWARETVPYGPWSSS
jgi:hypothetical protein